MKSIFTLQILILSIFLLSFACVYDPPRKGGRIYVCNQSNHPILALWSINEASLIRFDTVLVNKRKVIQRMPNYLPEYSSFLDFIPLEKLENASRDKSMLKYYIIDEVNLTKSAIQIIDSSLFKIIEISPDSLLKNKINNLEIRDDTMILEHNHNLEFIRK